MFSRKSAQGGGSLILVRENSMQTKERKDIVDLSVERQCEVSCVELDKHIIICVYKPPDACFETFIDVLGDVLELASNKNKGILLCGDFNTDLLVDKKTKRQLTAVCKLAELCPIFNEPTRITAETATCIDNIYANFKCAVKEQISKLTSDHKGQAIRFTAAKTSDTPTIICRPITKERTEKFKTAICNKIPELQLAHNSEDPNSTCNTIFHILESEFSNIYTIKEVKISRNPKFAEWATRGIFKSRDTLYELYERRNLYPSTELTNTIKSYYKMFKQVCNVAKSNFIRNKIEKSVNKIKTTWDIIRKETSRNKNTSKVETLKVNGTITDNHLEIVESFQIFFGKITKELTKSLNSSTTLALNLIEKNVKPRTVSHPLFNFHKVTSNIVVKTFHNLKCKKTEDLWGLSIQVLVGIIPLIAPNLSLLFNECIEHGIFPDIMKMSKVIPIHKAGCKQDPANYRPVSILPAISKIFEKLLLNQILSYFASQSILNEQQCGFIKGKSTKDAGLKLQSYILKAWDDKCDVIGVFCDLSKAFDCVDHDILIMKLKYYGLDVKALDLVSSYLSNRFQRVCVANAESSPAPVNLGVPQGSILGPFLFLAYVNDLPFMIQAQSNVEVIMYADDTSLLFKIKRQETNLQFVNSTLDNVNQWFSANNLALNPSKTKCIKFTVPNVRQVKNSIILADKELEFIDHTTFLGITIDAKLQWGPHIENLTSRLNSAVHAIREVRKLTDVATARLVYHAYFHSIMSYGILMWGAAADIENIFKLQKRAIRAIYKLSPRTSLRNKFKDINIMTVHSLYIYENIMYARKHRDQLKTNKDIQTNQMNTRNKLKIAIPKLRLCKSSKTFIKKSIVFYNLIPQTVLEQKETRFRNIIKKVLSKGAYYKCEEFLKDKNIWKLSDSSND